MGLILNLESSTEICSVSISRGGQLVDFIEDEQGQNHARLLSVFASELMERNNLSFHQLDAVAVSKGPGSYTGLRIGVSLAKGLCYGSNIPLIAISPLQAMSSHVIENLEKFNISKSSNLLFCPMIDARRMEVYTAIYDNNGQEQLPVSAQIINKDSFNDLLKKHQLLFFGNGAAKCQPLITCQNARFIEDIKTSAQFMCSLSNKAFKNNQFEDLAYFEPFYLKNFIAGVPKKNILKP